MRNQIHCKSCNIHRIIYKDVETYMFRPSLGGIKQRKILQSRRKTMASSLLYFYLLNTSLKMAGKGRNVHIFVLAYSGQLYLSIVQLLVCIA
jgi:hypothetical protein